MSEQCAGEWVKDWLLTQNLTTLLRGESLSLRMIKKA